ncbi:cell wall-binding repeat-containing protein [Microaceticoccus formicicus]|uniref:cell wall-binding repeat-containing protein n=1 Tax=Microaceticoccus formicicus TaxID=3118105 RepID=UPI003CD0498B|nr:cell wall-binding repeat-containing protein [Peptoniphilaceae bacterium AMB_02]
MQRLIKRAILLLFVTTLLLIPVIGSADGEVIRISGSNRYETSLKLNQYFGWANSAIVINGESFPDSISATSLSAQIGAPIYISANVEVLRGEFNRLGVSNVIIVGGENSVSKDIEDNLRDTYNVKRLAGRNRYATSDFVANYAGLNTVAVVSGQDYKDALISTNFLKPKNVAIKLSDGVSSIPDFNIKYVVGENAVESHENTYRINTGNTEFNALKIFETMPRKSNLIIAGDGNFADALSAGGALEVMGSTAYAC